jgi:antirestriction protein ArdC
MAPAVESKELVERIAQGIEAARESEGFKAFLQTAARFHHYSLGNTLLIMLQRPTATRVAGFHTWLNLKRAVRKGEHGIRILAPMVRKASADTDEDEANTRIFFKVVSVFDVEQTDGEPLPSPVTLLDGDDSGLYDRLLSVAQSEGLSVDRTPNESSANGFYEPDAKRIWISPELPSRLMAAKTLAHELSHHFADHRTNGHCRGEAETIAEASAFIVLNHFGHDSGAYTFGYVATWADAATFKAKLSEIQRTAARIIDAASASPSTTEARELVMA